MQRRYFFTILVLAQLLAALVLARPALAEDAGSLSGSVFVDANSNALPEPGEALVPGALVHVRSQANPTLELAVQADGSGYFLLRNVPYGVYDVCATAADGTGLHVLAAEVSEVNAQVLLDVPVSDANAGAAPAQNRTLFLPLVTAGA